MGWKQVGRASFFLDDVSVPASCLIGEENRGLPESIVRPEIEKNGGYKIRSAGYEKSIGQILP